MKKFFTVLVVLLVIVSMLFGDMRSIDARGMLCNTPLSTAYRLAAGAISNITEAIGSANPSYTDYTVTVVDDMGNPISDVIVKFTNASGESKSRVTNKDGVVVLKNALVTDYTIALEQGFSTAVIDQSTYTLKADMTSYEIVLRNAEKTVDIFGEVNEGSYAYYIGEGSYDVHADEGIAYYVFTARITGIYKVSISTANTATTVGYYGMPMFVQSTHRGEGEYDGRSFELVIQDVSTPYVLAVKNCDDAEVILTIERVDNAPFDPEFAEWNSIEKTADIDKCVIPDGTTLQNFDVTDPSLSVELHDDGFYYTTDGRLVYIKVTGTNEAYLPGASLAYLAGYVDNNIGMNIGGYIYDENGDFVEKRNYNLMIEEYMKYCDSKYGVVPLTEELAECMMLHGTSTGWWNPSAGNYLFEGDDVVLENAWLFLCMIEE